MPQSSGPVSGEVLVKIIEVPAGAAGVGEGAVGGMGGPPPSGPHGAPPSAKTGTPAPNSSAGLLGKFLPMMMGLTGTFGLIQLVRSSRIANESLSQVFNLLGALVDVILLPVIPVIVALMKGLVPLITGIMTFMKDPIGFLGKIVAEVIVGITSLFEKVKTKVVDTWHDILKIAVSVWHIIGESFRYVFTEFFADLNPTRSQEERDRATAIHEAAISKSIADIRAAVGDIADFSAFAVKEQKDKPVELVHSGGAGIVGGALAGSKFGWQGAIVGGILAFIGANAVNEGLTKYNREHPLGPTTEKVLEKTGFNRDITIALQYSLDKLLLAFDQFGDSVDSNTKAIREKTQTTSRSGGHPVDLDGDSRSVTSGTNP